MSAVLVQKPRDLDLRPEQVVTLVAIQALNSALRAFGTEFSLGLYTSIAPMLGQIGGAAVSTMTCPFGDPETEIIQDFDAKKNMYLHCLHAPQHCWSMRGTHKPCP